MSVSVSVMTRYRRWVGSMRTIVASTTGTGSYVGKDDYLHESFRQWRNSAPRGGGLQRAQFPPANWFAHHPVASAAPAASYKSLLRSSRQSLPVSTSESV